MEGVIEFPLGDMCHHSTKYVIGEWAGLGVSMPSLKRLTCVASRTHRIYWGAAVPTTLLAGRV